jgi:hypothetical protein
VVAPLMLNAEVPPVLVPNIPPALLPEAFAGEPKLKAEVAVVDAGCPKPPVVVAGFAPNPPNPPADVVDQTHLWMVVDQTHLWMMVDQTHLWMLVSLGCWYQIQILWLFSKGYQKLDWLGEVNSN